MGGSGCIKENEVNPVSVSSTCVEHVSLEEEERGNSSSPSGVEIRKALSQLKRGKAASDSISVDLLLDGGDEIISSLEILFGYCFERSMTPLDFNWGILILIHKKGCKSDPSNYRGITLMNMVAKLYSKVLLNRLAPYFEAHFVKDEQGGFRAERATEDQCFALNNIAWQFRRRNKKPLYLLFVDFRKAFDTVNRDLLWQKLRNIGVDGNLIRAIRSLYVGHKARLRLNGELSEFFPIELGVKQGCVLSPELFKEFINDLVEVVNAVGKGVKLDFMSISCLLFADDLVLMSESLEGLKVQSAALESWCIQNNLEVNTLKTKMMVMNSTQKTSQRGS